MNGVERLHYFNGQRLVARDLEIEQRYFIKVRRRLNRGLYSPGVVDGLVVSKVNGRHVRVSPGLALDPAGREAILLSDTTLTAPSRLPSSALGGYFLVIQYGEETQPGTLADCRERAGTTPPDLIRETPRLAWTETWPNQQACGGKGGHPSDCAVVLALVTLDASCQVTAIAPGVRQYAHSAVPSQTHAYGLEGEKDIDPYNPKVLHFQIRGGPPDAVLLYLWADAISSLLYTELGRHKHTLSATGSVPQTDVASHRHWVPSATTTQDSHVVTNAVVAGSGTTADPGPDPLAAGTTGHTHPIRQAANPPGGIATNTSHPDQFDSILTYTQTTSDGVNAWSGIPSTYGPTNPEDPTAQPDDVLGQPGTTFIQMDGVHTHDSSRVQTDKATAGTFSPTETITVSGDTADAGNTAGKIGSLPYKARDGDPAYGYFDSLQLKLDGIDITGLVTAQLGWASLGDGTAGHPMVTSGTGSIDLFRLGAVPLGVGSHKLEMFLIPAAKPSDDTGGKVLYNLFVQ